jgi:hypothetical protein
MEQRAFDAQVRLGLEVADAPAIAEAEYDGRLIAPEGLVRLLSGTAPLVLLPPFALFARLPRGRCRSLGTCRALRPTPRAPGLAARAVRADVRQMSALFQPPAVRPRRAA